MSLLISGGTLIDAVSDRPIEGCSIWIDGGRIKAIARRDDFGARPEAQLVNAQGKYIIPGLMNANVHLLCDVRLENLARYSSCYEDMIVESAQVALKSGLTTVFDTWGPRRFLMAARDKINRGQAQGARVFCAGNIVGFDGPFSQDFSKKTADVASPALMRRINAIWVENVGRHLMWLPPERVATEVRAYIAKGIDFVKYGSNEHFGTSAGAFLAFSPRVQEAIVAEAHNAGITAQAHTMTVEGLRIAIEAGCDLIQHANVTGPVPIPESTLELMLKKKTGAVVFPWTQRGLDWTMANVSEAERTMWEASDVNLRKLLRCGAPLLLANDGAVFSPETLADPAFAKSWAGVPEDDSLLPLATGHFVWFKAMEEKGCPPIAMLQAATRNVALAYGKIKDLGTLEPGKIADMLILEKNPLQAADNYRSIDLIIKDGIVIDRHSLPENPILTKPMEPPVEEEAAYVPAWASSIKCPMCPTCAID